ncbi:MAG TPA: hypothetical protein DEA91_11835, partial [Paenibacillus sp.]|nr:hypothetical protein [Paenibacillus sp.]
ASGFDKENFKYDAINDKYTCPLSYGLPFKWNGKQMGKSISVILAKPSKFADKKNPARLPKAEGR